MRQVRELSPWTGFLRDGHQRGRTTGAFGLGYFLSCVIPLGLQMSSNNCHVRGGATAGRAPKGYTTCGCRFSGSRSACRLSHPSLPTPSASGVWRHQALFQIYRSLHIWGPRVSRPRPSANIGLGYLLPVSPVS